jgi:hypothetical protein
MYTAKMDKESHHGSFISLKSTGGGDQICLVNDDDSDELAGAFSGLGKDPCWGLGTPNQCSIIVSRSSNKPVVVVITAIRSDGRPQWIGDDAVGVGTEGLRVKSLDLSHSLFTRSSESINPDSFYCLGLVISCCFLSHGKSKTYFHRFCTLLVQIYICFLLVTSIIQKEVCQQGQEQQQINKTMFHRPDQTA